MWTSSDMIVLMDTFIAVPLHSSIFTIGEKLKASKYGGCFWVDTGTNSETLPHHWKGTRHYITRFSFLERDHSESRTARRHVDTQIQDSNL